MLPKISRELDAGGQQTTKLPPRGLVEQFSHPSEIPQLDLLDAGGQQSTKLPPGGLVEQSFLLLALDSRHGTRFLLYAVAPE